MVCLYHALNSPLIKLDMIPRGNGHKAVRQERNWIDFRQKFPLVPPVIVFRCGQNERILRLRQRKHVASQLAGKVARQDRMVRLSNQDEMLALLLNDHSAGLARSNASITCLWTRNPSWP